MLSSLPSSAFLFLVGSQDSSKLLPAKTHIWTELDWLVLPTHTHTHTHTLHRILGVFVFCGSSFLSRPISKVAFSLPAAFYGFLLGVFGESGGNFPLNYRCDGDGGGNGGGRVGGWKDGRMEGRKDGRNRKSRLMTFASVIVG